MKNKKGLFIVAALALVLVVVLIGCGTAQTQTATTPTPAPETTKAQPVKVANIVEDVKNSGHYKFFPNWVKKGQDAVKNEHYGDNCIGCHSAVKIVDDKDAKFADFLPGGKYAAPGKDEGITCRVCHNFGGKEMISLKNPGWDACTKCHTGSGVTLGKAVHHPQKEMFEGPAVGPIPATPSFKYKNMKDSFSCVDCHVTNSTRHTFEVPGVTITYDPSSNGTVRSATKMDWDVFKKEAFGQQKCQTCHSTNVDQVIDNMKKLQEDVEKRMAALAKVNDEWAKKVSTLDKNDPKVKAFNEFTTYYSFVEADSSKGVHNPPYIKALLEQAEASAAQLK